jgi:hypothetical protein
MASHVYLGAANAILGDKTRYQGGIFRVTVGDGGWQRLTGGLPEDVEARALAVHPRDHRTIYAGTQHGPYRSRDGGDTWHALAFPHRDREVFLLPTETWPNKALQLTPYSLRSFLASAFGRS